MAMKFLALIISFDNLDGQNWKNNFISANKNYKYWLFPINSLTTTLDILFIIKILTTELKICNYGQIQRIKKREAINSFPYF